MCPAVGLLSGVGPPRLALGATEGLGGGLACCSEGVILGGGGLGAGTGVLGGRVSGMDCGFGVIKGFSEFLQGWGAEAGPGSGVV